MVEIEATLFDALRDGSAPTEIFGAMLTDSDHSIALGRFESLGSTARTGIAETFHRTISRNGDGVRMIDDIIREMWAEGWSASSGNIRRFTAHFGVLFSQALLAVVSAVPIFRSVDSLDHFSVWLPASRLEVFPFHKTYKALLHADGESLRQVYEEFVRTSSRGATS